MIPEGMHPVPAGHIPAVVTYLGMTQPAITAAKPFPKGVSAAHETPDLAAYRALFRAVGAPWLWSSRLKCDDAALTAILRAESTELWVIRRNGAPIGLVELDFQGATCELAYFGMIVAETGQGLGGPMMALAQTRAFSRPITRFFVHTCNWDDPRALAFYQRAGFTPEKMMVEVFPDPRAAGLHAPGTAPQVPQL